MQLWEQLGRWLGEGGTNVKATFSLRGSGSRSALKTLKFDHALVCGCLYGSFLLQGAAGFSR